MEDYDVIVSRNLLSTTDPDGHATYTTYDALTDIHGKPSVRMPASPTPTVRIQAVIADFVTPGDLDKSPSLTTFGKIIP